MIPILESLKPLFLTLEELQIPYAVVGSVSSGIWGVPRQTNDPDLVVAMRALHVQELADQRSEEFLIDQQSL